MPLYEYECSVCNRRFELLQKFSDEPARICTYCGGNVTRLISSSAFHFKGTGWYATDYARQKSETPSPQNGGKSSEGADSKPEPSSAPSQPSQTSKTTPTKPTA